MTPSPLTFELLARDGAGRVGRLKTAHGTVTTPTLLPVLNPNLPLVEPGTLRARFGCEFVITNAYILRKKPELRERALKEGVRAVLGWDGPVMTDSGTFQTYVYGGSLDIDPLEIVRFQRDIGVDVGTILDVFSTPDRTYEEAKDDVLRTIQRAVDAHAERGEMALNCTVQGSVYPELRALCARTYRERALGDVHPIGGVVPLMEGQRYATLVDVIVAAKRELDPSKPVHLFGAGHPLVFPFAALLGCDLFDSASYAKYAKDGRMIFEDGTRALADLEETWCTCPVCAAHTPKELRELAEAEREARLAEHNLYVSFAEIRRVRQAIRDGDLWSLVEARARAHPSLLDALKAIVRHSEWIETLEPASKKNAWFYAGPESARRPEVLRYRRRLAERWRPAEGRALVELPMAARPFSATYWPVVERLDLTRAAPFVASVLGPVPLEIDETWPLAQSVEPSTLDAESETSRSESVRALARSRRCEVVPRSEAAAGVTSPDAWDRVRVAAMADYQFGAGAGAALLAGQNVAFKKSRNTGKLRTVTVDGEHVLSLRAEDGRFTLKIAGARRLHRGLAKPSMRIVVHPDSVPFNREGKSAFAKFVLAVDPALRAGEECLVVSESDDLVACGQLLLAPSEVPFFKTGAAVYVREGDRGA